MRVAVLIVAVAVASCQPPAGKPPLVPEKYDPVPAFAFTERGGKTVTNEDLKGKVWVASFVFTRCTGSCPQVAATLAKLQEEFKNEPKVRLVTFTIDPERDTLEDLKSYAQKYRADADRWLFLSGPEAPMHKFSTEGFKLLAARSKTPKPGDEFDHISKLAVVDGNGVIRGYFDGMAELKREGGQAVFDDSQKKLRETIAALVKE